LEGKDIAKEKTFLNFARAKKPPSQPTFYFCSNNNNTTTTTTKEPTNKTKLIS
jgi:hypothetical protein